jgi:hypothetical protein
MKSRETERVEVVVAQCLLSRVEANPRTRYTPADSDVVRAYLERGGSLLMLVEPDYMVDQTLASVLAETGIRLGDGGRLSTLSQYRNRATDLCKELQLPLTAFLLLPEVPRGAEGPELPLITTAPLSGVTCSEDGAWLPRTTAIPLSGVVCSAEDAWLPLITAGTLVGTVRGTDGACSPRTTAEPVLGEAGSAGGARAPL